TDWPLVKVLLPVIEEPEVKAPATLLLAVVSASVPPDTGEPLAVGNSVADFPDVLAGVGPVRKPAETILPVKPGSKFTFTPAASADRAGMGMLIVIIGAPTGSVVP